MTDVEKLIERPTLILDNKRVRELIQDKVCMVTGGGGSIGSELSRQIISCTPKKLIIVDIYENNAYNTAQELYLDYSRNIPLVIEIASVQDKAKMELLFDKYKPDLVFHAAAHKHVPLMETAPEEAVKNNCLGTYITASLALKYKAERFLLISTDKAVHPTSVMGATKRCCEKLMTMFSKKTTDTAFVTVRFGNVLGSNGSVIELFEKQIKHGGPVTVTHPDMTRYFMTVKEAVSLVLKATAGATTGDILVLDMGTPVKIVEIAEKMIKMYGMEPYRDIKIEFIGIRQGDKLTEELGDFDKPIGNIRQAAPITLPDDFEASFLQLCEDAKKNDTSSVIQGLKRVVPSYNRVE